MSRLAWVDTETTGLDPNRDALLEVAMVITEANLTHVAELSLVIDHLEFTEQVISRCDDYVTKMHTDNGLFLEMLDPDAMKAPMGDVEDLFIEFMKEHGVTGGLVNGDPYKSPMCGSTVSFDRGFLKMEMPKLEKCFSYRHIDVSTVVELVRRWYPHAPDFEPGVAAHRALADVQASVRRLHNYHWCYFARPRNPDPQTQAIPVGDL